MRKWIYKLLILGCTIVFLTRFCIGHFNAHEISVPKHTRVSGYVVGMPQYKQHHTVFVFKSKQYGQLKLSWYGKRPFLYPGEFLSLTVRLKSTSIPKFRQGFDYPTFLKRRGFVAYGSVIKKGKDLGLGHRRRGDDTVSGNDKIEPLASLRLKIRESIIHQLYQISGGKQAIPIILALSIGDKSRVTQQYWAVLQQTGTSHLIAISGLHIGLIALFIYWVARLCWSSSLILSHTYSPSRFGVLIGFVVAAGYAALSGFGLPAQRTIIMLGCAALSSLMGVSIGSFKPWFLAMMICLSLEPWAIYSISMWLSFLAVFILIFTLSHRVGREGGLKTFLWPQFAIFILLIPVTLYSFGVVSMISFFVNLWAIPLVSFSLVPCVFLAMIFIWCEPISHALLWLSVHLANIWWWMLTESAHIPYGGFHACSPTLGITILAELGLFLLFFPRAFPVRFPGVILTLPAMLFVLKHSLLG